MKTLLFLFCALCMLACQSKFDAITDEKIQTRAIVDEINASISNPNLINNWENIQFITLNTSTPNGNKQVTSPWFDGASTLLSDNFRLDIKKEDGWKMVFHTFKQVGIDEKQNYICFHNMFTGRLKFFYYYEGEQKSQGTQWFVRTANGENSKIFNLVDYITKTDTAKCEHNSIILSNQTGDPTNGISPGWNGFEFDVPYCTDYQNINFTIGAYDKCTVSYSFYGEEKSINIGTATSINQSTSNTVTTTTTIEGTYAKKYLDYIGQNAQLGSNLNDSKNSINSGNYTSAISFGVDQAFGRTTTTTSSTSSSTSEKIQLTTTGNITMAGLGSSTVTSGIPALTFNLYRAMNATESQPVSSCLSLVCATNLSDVSKHYVGVWTLRSNVPLIYPRYTVVRNIEWQFGSTIPDKGLMLAYGTTQTPQLYPYKMVPFMNPDAEAYLIDQKNETKLIRCDRLNGENYKEGVKDFSEKILKTKLLYKDDDKCFYEGYYVKKDVSCDGYANPNSSSAYYYDWGVILNGRLLVVLSCENTYSYMGKIITVRQSRIYEPSYSFDEAHIVEYEGYKDAMFNYRKPAFGIHFDEDDMDLYMSQY